MRNIHQRWLLALVLVMSALVAGSCDRDESQNTPTSAEGLAVEDPLAESRGASMPFADAQVFIEFNSTANDAGIQVFLDGDPWKRLAITGRRGEELLEIEAEGGMAELGLTELRFEGAEPDPSEVLDAFPAGTYKFRGRAVEGFRLSASATLSHDLPAAPVFSPSEGEVVDPDNVEITWEEIAGVELYQVIVESDENDFVMEVSVSPETTSLHVPPTFLESNTEYKVEILAIAPNGNRTITEGTFVTGP